MSPSSSIRRLGRSAVVWSTCLATVLPAGVVLLPATASAQPAATATSSYGDPVITGLDVQQARRLAPGTTLAFTLYGTPGGRAQIAIGSTVGGYYLNETTPGVYEGTYTVRSGDRLDASTPVTANLRVGNKVATAALNESLLAGAPWRQPDARGGRGAGVVAAAAPRIDRFDVVAPRTLEPGADIEFSLAGTPGAEASARIAGVPGKIFLSESAPGEYQGRYTVSERDRIANTATATGLLRVGERQVSMVQRNAMAATGSALGSNGIVGLGGNNNAAVVQPVAAAATRCLSCGVVEAVNPVEVKGDAGYLGMIAGGVAGAVLGSQVGSGSGRTAAQVLGAAGGAYAGRQIEGRVRKNTHYEVVVRLDSGGTQTVNFAEAPGFAIGSRVRVENGTLTGI